MQYSMKWESFGDWIRPLWEGFQRAFKII